MFSCFDEKYCKEIVAHDFSFNTKEILSRSKRHTHGFRLVSFISMGILTYKAPCSRISYTMIISSINNCCHKLSQKFLHVGVSNDYFYTF